MIPIRVVIVDDQDLVRDGLRAVLEDIPDITVVGDARDGEAAITMAEKLAPAVVLMDLRMPRLDGVKATARIVTATSARVIVLSTFGDEDMVIASLRAGACGYLVKDATREAIVDAVRAAAAGQAPLSPEIAGLLVDRVRNSPATVPGVDLPALTPRELDVLLLVAEGLSNSEIAQRLFLSTTTVKTYAGTLFDKLGVRDRVQAAVLAYRSGVVSTNFPHRDHPS
jgi:DNA-binding NarL/FixJ family response regulator